jgi:hypothetical protein
MATAKPVSQQFITKMFSRMDDEVHEIVAKPIQKPVVTQKPTKSATKQGD